MRAKERGRWIIGFDGSTGEPTLISRLYRGYTISPIGRLIGLVWTFFDVMIGFAVLAWLYNKLTGSTES